MKSLLPLLNAISANEKNLDLQHTSTELINFSINSGVASLLKHYLKPNQENYSSAFFNQLTSAELTAKIITHNQLQALDDLLLKATPIIDEVILLKGIFLCQHYYPQAHLRIMSDIDILVSNKDSKPLENILLSMGYKQKSSNTETFYQSHHHSMPFYNQENNVWIEVHQHLFSGNNPVLYDNLFKIENIYNNCIPMNIQKYSTNVKQLSTELHLIYTCTHWANELKIHKSGMQIIDMIFLIINTDKKLNWDKLFSLASNTVSASYLYLVLSYFEKNKIIQLPENYHFLIKLKYSNMGYLNILILHKIIHTYSLGEKKCNKIANENNLEIIWSTLLLPSSSVKNLLRLPWNILFPPKVTGRYDIKFLLGRLKSILLIR